MIEIVVAELGGDGTHELFPQRLVGLREQGAVQGGEIIGGEIALAEARIGHEEGHLGPPLAVVAGGELANFRQVLPQGRLAQRAELRKGLVGEEARAGGLAVVVQLAAVDVDFRSGDHLPHFVGRFGQRADTPTFAPLFDGRANLLVAHQQEAHLMLGNQLLQELVGPEGELHVIGIGSNQNRVVLHDQIDRVLPLVGLFLAAEGRQAGRLPLPAEPVEIRHPLRGVNARQGHHRVGEGEDRGHAGLQFPVAVFGQRMFAKDVQRHGRRGVSGQGPEVSHQGAGGGGQRTKGNAGNGQPLLAHFPDLGAPIPDSYPLFPHAHFFPFSGEDVTKTWLPKYLRAAATTSLSLTASMRASKPL